MGLRFAYTFYEDMTMTKAAIKTATNMLKNHVQRSEIIGTGNGSYALSVCFNDGYNRIFHSLYDVEQKVEEMQARKSAQV